MSGPGILVELGRPLPSFKDWLEAEGVDLVEGDRGAFADLLDLAERTVAQNPTGYPPEAMCFLRMWKAFCIATVEVCNSEWSRHGQNPATIAAMLPRVMASASMYGTASILRANTPWRDIAKMLTQEFSFGAKTAADQLEEQYSERQP